MKRFAVIGLGRFGGHLAELLGTSDAEVIAVDINRELVEAIRDKVSFAVCLDATEEDALRSQGIHKADTVVVGIGSNFEANALTTVLLKELGVSRVISRAATAVRGDILSRIGADAIVNPERESADRWAARLVSPQILERMHLAEGYTMAQIEAPTSFHNKTLAELAVRKRNGVNVVAIRRTTETTDESGQKRTREYVISVPMPDSKLLPGDILYVIGSEEALAGFPAK